MSEGAPKPYTEISWAEGMERMRRLGRDPTIEAFQRYARQYQMQPNILTARTQEEMRTISRLIDGAEYLFDGPRRIDSRPYGEPRMPKSVLRAIHMGRTLEAAIRGMGETAGRAAEAAKGFGEAAAKATERSETAEGDTMGDKVEFAGIDFADSLEAKTCVFIVQTRGQGKPYHVGRRILDRENRLTPEQTDRWERALLEAGQEAIAGILKIQKEMVIGHPVVSRILTTVMRVRAADALKCGWGWKQWLETYNDDLLGFIKQDHEHRNVREERPEPLAMGVHADGDIAVVKQEIDTDDHSISLDMHVRVAETFARKRMPGKAIRVEIWKAGTCKMLREDRISADGTKRWSELISPETGERRVISGTYEKTFHHNGGEETPAKEIPMGPGMRRVAMDTAVELARHGIEIRTDRILGDLDEEGNVKGEVHTTEVDHGSPLICEHHAPTSVKPCRARIPRPDALSPRRFDVAGKDAAGKDVAETLEWPNREIEGTRVEFLADLGRWREDMISEYRRHLGAKGWPNCPVTRHPVDVVVGRIPRKRGTDPNAETAIARSLPYHAIIICRYCHGKARKIRQRTGERIDIEQGAIAK